MSVALDEFLVFDFSEKTMRMIDDLIEDTKGTTFESIINNLLFQYCDDLRKTKTPLNLPKSRLRGGEKPFLVITRLNFHDIRICLGFLQVYYKERRLQDLLVYLIINKHKLAFPDKH